MKQPIIDLSKIRPFLKKDFENRLKVCNDGFTQEYLISLGDFVNNDLNTQFVIECTPKEQWEFPVNSYIINNKIIHQSAGDSVKHLATTNKPLLIIMAILFGLLISLSGLKRIVENYTQEKNCFKSFDNVIVCR
jgi:hypothetical protein